MKIELSKHTHIPSLLLSEQNLLARTDVHRTHSEMEVPQSISSPFINTTLEMT